MASLVLLLRPALGPCGSSGPRWICASKELCDFRKMNPCSASPFPTTGEDKTFYQLLHLDMWLTCFAAAATVRGLRNWNLPQPPLRSPCRRGGAPTGSSVNEILSVPPAHTPTICHSRVWVWCPSLRPSQCLPFLLIKVLVPSPATWQPLPWP